jgi:small redox-active disulfide protein 2
MSIQVLGTGCATCKTLFEVTEQIALELNLGKVEYITDLAKMVDMGIMASPALVVDGEVKATGKMSREKVKEILTQNKTELEPQSGCSCDGCC